MKRPINVFLEVNIGSRRGAYFFLQVNPFITGNTPVCDWVFESVDDITLQALQYLLVTLKRMLQNYRTIRKKFILVANANDHIIFVMKIAGL